MSSDEFEDMFSYKIPVKMKKLTDRLPVKPVFKTMAKRKEKDERKTKFDKKNVIPSFEAAMGNSSNTVMKLNLIPDKSNQEQINEASPSMTTASPTVGVIFWQISKRGQLNFKITHSHRLIMV